MAVLKDSSVSTSGTSIGSISLSVTVAANTDKALFAFAGNGSSGGGAAFSNWTFNTSETMTEIDDTVFGSFHAMGAAVLIAPTATTANISVTFGATQEEGFLASYSAYSVDQTTPNTTIRTNTGSTSPAWVANDGIADGMSIGFFWGNSTATAVVDGIPEYIAVGTATSSAGATSITPTGQPAGRLLGDLEFCSVATENNETISCSSSGWVKLGSTVQQNATWQQELWVRLYDGTNVNPAFTWTSSVGCSARRWTIRDTLASTTLGGFHTSNSGSASPHTITGQNSSGDDSIAMYLSHAEANTALAADAGYVEKFDAGSATGPYRLAVGTRDQATSGAGADNFSATGAAASWVMRLVEVQNAANGDQTHQTKVDNIAGGDCGTLSHETSTDYNTFGWTLTTPGEWRAIAFAIRPSAGAASIVPILMAQYRSRKQ